MTDSVRSETCIRQMNYKFISKIQGKKQDFFDGSGRGDRIKGVD